MNRRTNIAAAAAAVALIGGGVIAVTAPAQDASAHTPQLACAANVVTLTLESYPKGSTVTGSIDGQTLLDHVAFGPATYTVSQAIDPKAEHVYSITVVGSDGQGNRSFSGKTSQLCGYTVTPPVTTPPTAPPTTAPPTPTPKPTSTPAPSSTPRPAPSQAVKPVPAAPQAAVPTTAPVATPVPTVATFTG